VPIKRASNDDETRADFALVKSIAALNSYLKLDKDATAYDATDGDVNGNLGYKLCKHLINVGLDVLVTVADSTSDIKWDALKDKGLYDIRFITLGDFTDDEGSGMSDAKKCAETRGDCTALFNLPVGYDYSIAAASASAGGSTQSEGETEGEAVTLAEPASVVEKIQKFFDFAGASEYCACFAPNFNSTNSDLVVKKLDADKSVKDTTDTSKYIRKVYEVTEQEIPAAFGYLFAYAASIKNNPEWYAVAGFQRGFIPELVDVTYELSTLEMLELQKRDASSIEAAYDLDTENDNVGAAINPIAYIRPAGYIIYGNRTFRYNDAAKKTTAQSFLNVRNMVSAIKKKLWDASRKFTFEPNNELLWIKFTSFVTPYLDTLKSGNGIMGYRFEKLPTTAKARLKCRLVIIPVEAVEDFEIDVTLADDLTVVG
jgi:hypothetical protein